MKLRILAVICLLSVLLPTGCKKAQADLRLYGINTGKADCLLFVLPDGDSLLVDTGTKASAPTIAAVLKLAGVWRIDHLVLTHGHKDHIGGLERLAEAYPIECIYTNVYDSATYSEKENTAIRSLAKEWHRMTPGRKLDGSYPMLSLSGVRLEFLAPDRSYTDSEDDNNNSLVLRITHGEVTFLLMGDATAHIEAQLVENSPELLPASFLKAGRHGLDEASTEAFVQAVAPQVAYLTGNPEDDPDSPDPAVVQRFEAAGAKVFTNASPQLAVCWVSDGQTLHEEDYLGRP